MESETKVAVIMGDGENDSNACYHDRIQSLESRALGLEHEVDMLRQRLDALTRAITFLQQANEAL